MKHTCRWVAVSGMNVECGMFTSDIDECTEYIVYGICDRSAGCVNLDGAYKCQCRKGYHGDGVVCHGTYYVR